MARTLLNLMTVCILALAAASASHAATIQGVIVFAGANWSKDGTSLTINSPSIVFASDDFLGQASVAISSLNYSPFSALDPLWETDDYSFAITSLSIISESATGLHLAGSGVVTDKNGILDNTAGDWDFSSGSWNWSSATLGQGAVIPEPSAAVLFFAGALVVRRGLGRRSA